MSKARELANLGNAYSDGALSNRNLIINGAMQVAQRGTSFTPSNGDYTLDRWRCSFNNSSSPTITQETGSTFGTKRTHLKLVSGASSTYSYVAQRIEDIAQFDGKTVTVSFDYKSDNSFNCSFEYHFGTGGSASLYDKHANTIAASSTVKRTSVTVTLDDISSKTIGAANTSHLALLFNMTANSKTLEITNVQLELGDTATPFEHRSYGDELARCQRYYQVLETGRLMSVGNGGGYSIGSTVLPVSLRASASISYVYANGSDFAGYSGMSGTQIAYTCTGFASAAEDFQFRYNLTNTSDLYVYWHDFGTGVGQVVVKLDAEL